ncbi:E3 ubiquitin-protein ligase atl42 [Phtheirospermum japonicum]|uniref:RING-type E3 ubiquitin transferase n=1 Tax=Phtheirospermum japonicum TaxID=374723 RepID=A0A830BMT2_9LAMI|nr:E3 ubiquitin-protein ligase atl42 [Phtheirospermum japonicum]
MNHLIITQHTVSSFVLLQFNFFLMGDDVKAQTLSDSTESGIPSQPHDSSLTNNFQPSLAVVIGMLAVMFSLTFILLLYAKFCHRASSFRNMTSHQIQDGLVRIQMPSSGVDKTVVESLPFFRFSSLKGSKEGLDCSVCLAKFLDVEILRLLPKCKHAFHMDCIDQWLEKHSTCPLCRRKVSADDLSQLPCSSSFRFLSNTQSELRDQESNMELYVEREESRHYGSLRFCIGSSFRKIQREDEFPIQQSMDSDGVPLHHKFNHRINVVSDVVLKNRWSDVTSSDLMFLNSELLSDVSGARFSSRGIRENTNDEMMMNSIKAELKRKGEFESKLREINSLELTKTSTSCSEQEILGGFKSKALNSCSDKRSMSEITLHPRLITELRDNNKNNSLSLASNSVKEERIRKLWLPIARKTAQWFANREQDLHRPNDYASYQIS